MPKTYNIKIHIPRSMIRMYKNKDYSDTSCPIATALEDHAPEASVTGGGIGLYDINFCDLLAHATPSKKVTAWIHRLDAWANGDRINGRRVGEPKPLRAVIKFTEWD